MSLDDLKARLHAEDVRPEWSDGIPCCSESCPSHDGKRCRKLGLKPDRICEPFVSEALGIMSERP